MFSDQMTRLQHDLHEHARPETQIWWQSYVKEGAPFLGVTMPIIRTVVRQWYRDCVQGRLDQPEQVDLALALFEGEYTEEKLAATLFLQEILLPLNAVDSTRDIERFGDLFARGRIYDWNTCDWFCVKVLGPLIKRNGVECANRISAWRGASNLWQARASLVAFVAVADQGVYYPAIEESCKVLIRRPERFAKTAVGWILRDVSRYDNAFASRVVEESIQFFSSESLRNATKYFVKDEQKRYRDRLKIA